MRKIQRREFLMQASASLAALALLPILPSGDKFMLIGKARGEPAYIPVSTVKDSRGWCSLKELNFGEIVMDKEGDVFIFDGVLRSLDERRI